MLELAVTALRSNVIPALLLDKSNCISDFHVTVPRSSGITDNCRIKHQYKTRRIDQGAFIQFWDIAATIDC
jgi:hypothetical protein